MQEEVKKTKLPNIVNTEEATVDEKGRVLLSKKKRERLGADFVITHGPLGCLVAYPQERWEAMVEEIFSYPATNPGREQYSRLLLGNAEDELNCDAQGRLVLPAKLRKVANIGKEVSLVGAGDRMEIWPAEEYERYKADSDNYGKTRRETFERAQLRMSGGA